jgi:acetylglutamate kinase
MKIVVKIGGAALDNKAVVQKFAHSVAELVDHGHKVVVIHGGGAAISRTLHELGRESQFVNGLRVTDQQTRDVALMVMAGHLNKQLVASIGAAGQPAIGLCGGDLRIFRAAKKKKAGTDLGYVGEICAVENHWLETMWQQGAVPVIASIALGSDGEYYNVNADEMASACAVSLHAHALVFLTDVPGVKDEAGAVIRWLNVHTIPTMVEQATVSGGMLPKLEACTTAIQRGVNRVRIMPANRVEALPGFFTNSLDCGTEVVA